MNQMVAIRGVPDTEEARREQVRERKRRERARKKQAAAVEFVRTDASLFLHPDRLSQKAGAPKYQLRRMALKELVDNALDAAPTATLTEVDEDTFIVEDSGPGIDPGKVATMFSVTRPMMSSKLIRRPTRGMVGNGNRVVAGAAFASGGNLVVESRGIRQELSFDRVTGDTVVTAKAASAVTTGAKITIQFGPALPRDKLSTMWGNLAIRLAGNAAAPMLTHPDWYSEVAFAEVVEAARGTAQDLANLFGIDLCHARRGSVEQGQSRDDKRDIDPDGPAAGLSLDLLKSLAPKPPKMIPIPENALGDAARLDLQSERQEVQGDHARILEGLRAYGASEDELLFLSTGKRVELNAMPSDQFIGWIESALREHGVQKVLPPAEMIEQRARQIIGLQHLKNDVAELEQAARRYAATVDLPADLPALMQAVFDADPTLPWEDALTKALAKIGGDA